MKNKVLTSLSTFVRSVVESGRFILALALVSALSPAARATLPGHNIAAGNITVTQNDFGNTTNSVTLSLSFSVNDFRVRGAGTGGSDSLIPLQSRGDFPVQIGEDATNDFVSGILMSSVTQNGRDNGEGTTNIYATSMIESQRLRSNTFDPEIILGAYFIPVSRAENIGAGNSTEHNINVAGAWFPYSDFIGGFARNSGDEFGLNPTNGSAANPMVLNQLIATPGLSLNTHFFDLGSGKMFVTLTNLGIDSRLDGVLLVSGAKNESANFGLSEVNTTNGGWNLFIKDNGQNTAANFEEDPIAFVFIPRTNTTVVSGRFLGDASIDTYSGASPQFTVTSNSVGTYELKITGYSETNGTLIISPEGGKTVNQDNTVSYQLNGTEDGWIIESRDLAAALLEAIPATEPVVSFVFVPGPTPGFSVITTNNLLTTESGGQAVFTVALHTQPTDDVTIGVSSSNTGEGTVSVSSLTFTTNNWNVPQTVTVTGVNDAIEDGSIAYTVVLAVATSTDPAYNGLNPPDVSVVNADNEAGITVSPTSGLSTTEAAGTATFNVRLNTQPTSLVTINLSSSDTTEGTVSPSSVQFTSGNWNSNQLVTVTGVNDAIDDGNIAYTIMTSAAISTDLDYSGLNPADVSAQNLDDDTAGVTISAFPNGLQLVEGKTNSYTVQLDTEPTANVTINIVSSDTAQGGTVSSPSLTFTPGNWNSPQTVVVTAADDLVADNNTAWRITNSVASGDSIYNAVAPMVMPMTTLNNDAVVTLPLPDLIYGIGLAAIGIDGQASIVDPNTPNYAGGTLTITLTANGTADDRLEIRNAGTGAGQIGVSGANVTYGGTTIGTFTGGVGTTPLVITLNSSATPAATEALMRSVTFRNVNSSPSLLTRTVSFSLAQTTGFTATINKGIRVGLLRYADFQEGADLGYGPYTGAADCHLRQAAPNTAHPTGGANGLFIDWPDAGMNNAFHVLLRFDNIIGNGFGQIPSNAIIVSAELYLDVNDQGDASPLYRMLIPWNAETETWTSRVNGVDQDDVESKSTFESQFGLANGDANTGDGTVRLGVTPDVQAWVNSLDPNYGWVMPGWSLRTDGTGFSPSEAPVVSDRPRLRVLWVPQGTPNLSFRQNVNDYTGARDTRLRENTPDTAGGTLVSAFVDWAVTGATQNVDQVLIRFEDIIGSASGQIPSGAQVHAAILDLTANIGNAMGDGGTFHAMLQPWQDTDTWNTLVNGVSADGTEAASTPSAAAGNAALDPNVQAAFLPFDLTADVQAWAAGTRPNYGWAILPWDGGGDGWGFGLSEQGTEGNRPRLRVFYTGGLVINTITRTATSATITFSGDVGKTYTILRANDVTGIYGSVGTATVQPDGVGTFTDNSPPATAAFYRITYP